VQEWNCESNTCAIYGVNTGKQCCASKFYADQKYYCSRAVPANEKCSQHKSCMSELCVDGVCQALKSDGTKCDINEQCSSGACAKIASKGNDNFCCKSRRSKGSDGTFYCEAEVANEIVCKNSASCESGYCHNNEICRAPSAARTACSADEGCLSGHCALVGTATTTSCCANGVFRVSVTSEDYCSFMVKSDNSLESVCKYAESCELGSCAFRTIAASTTVCCKNGDFVNPKDSKRYCIGVGVENAACSANQQCAKGLHCDDDSKKCTKQANTATAI
jgi:hypothetical protein